MDRTARWILAIVVALALVGLILFARGPVDHGTPTGAATAQQIEGGRG